MTVAMGAPQQRMAQMMLDVVREIAAEQGTGHLGSEHVGLLAVRGAGGLAELTGVAPDVLAGALRRRCRLARETPVDRPRLTSRTARLITMSITLAGIRGVPAPTAAELVGALLNEPGCEAWRDLARVGVTERDVERAQRAAFGQANAIGRPVLGLPARARDGD